MGNENENEKNARGSVLVLTIISALILSLIMTGLLSIGTTEIHTTRNFQLNKIAYYAALEGAEDVRNMIIEAQSVGDVENIVKDVYSTRTKESFSDGSNKVNTGIYRTYITGSLLDFEENTPQTLKHFEGFPAPPLLGASQSLNLTPMVWKVYITAEALAGKNAGYTEIVSGIYYTVGSYD
jgi:hypothetical protein